MRKRSWFSTRTLRVFFLIFIPIIILFLTLFNRNIDLIKIRSKLTLEFEAKNVKDPSSSAIEECPEHFRWIHEDLKPWKRTGITREIFESGKNISNFRLVILKGKVYAEKYLDSFQTRDLFTVWGILQLLKLYPKEVPDLELFFECGDLPVVEKSAFKNISPPTIFHYSGNQSSFDIVFPDWSFWGWIELNIRPWETTSKNIHENNQKMKWKDRVPYAFWKGNTRVSYTRYDLRKCNGSNPHDWNALIYTLNWKKETAKGFRNTKLENQCQHRYKIYVEGRSWSVSEKYILACDSMTLFIKPNYYDFFTRSLVPLHHYWPISIQNMCPDIKFAVDWGNTHPHEAEAIGKRGSNYMVENLRMELVYDYMLHLLQEYAKLLKFKPTIPKGAFEISSEILYSPEVDLVRKFFDESKVKSPKDTPPCKMPPPYEPQELVGILEKKDSVIKQVEMKASQYYLHKFGKLQQKIPENPNYDRGSDQN